MALSEVFRAAHTVRSRMPITARELVEWTYAVQRTQGVPEPSLEPQGRSQTGIVVDRMLEFAQLGCKVDVSSNAAAIWGEARCDEDAIVVHEIVRGMPVAVQACSFSMACTAARRNGTRCHAAVLRPGSGPQGAQTRASMPASATTARSAPS
jgi:hypothetical protein